MQTKQHGSLVGFHTHYQLKLKFNEPVGNHAAIGAEWSPEYKNKIRSFKLLSFLGM